MSPLRSLLQTLQCLLVLSFPVSTISSPPEFPASGNGLWYTAPARGWAREWLPVGNGYLAAMVPGGTARESTQVNIESLWTGGPFADPSYNGGNKQPSEQEETAKALQRIRQTIFSSPIGEIDDVDELTTDAGQYGSYAGAGHILSTINVTGAVSNYVRWLDLDQGLARTTWSQGGIDFSRTTFCSHPRRACVQHLKTTNSKPLPSLTYVYASSLEPGFPAPNITGRNGNSLLVDGRVSNSPPGMTYAFIIKGFSSSPSAQINSIQFPVPYGAPFNGSLEIRFPNASATTSTDAWITWQGETSYSMDAGSADYGYTFKGIDPVAKLLGQPMAHPPPVPVPTDYPSILKEHIADMDATLNRTFALDLGQKPILDVSTDVLKKRYEVDGTGEVNRYLDWLLFNYGRYLLASSSRGFLPPNLQGKWAEGYANAWSSDYHSNINIQMNYWAAEMTGLGSTTLSLFNYFEKTWVPRGRETARVLYNITRGWVTHNEMNIFGHTGMKKYQKSAEWANYPEANAWMMFHVFDRFDHDHDLNWWKRQGWPLLKGVAQFHLDKLIPDSHFNDSSLVVSPCNSPEQPQITFGCAHAQQIIWQLFNAVEKGFEASGDGDVGFLEEVRAKRAQMDRGLKIGSWGQLQEWKVEKDSPTDHHRHLSHLIGLYPGYAILYPNTSTSPSTSTSKERYTPQQLLDAARVSLEARGNGTAPDGNAGWEKVWRAACWAQLGDAGRFYHLLSYAVSENFASNLFSLYNPAKPEPVFQIDANLGYPAAVMNAILQAPDVPSLDSTLVITLLPALPRQWPDGSVRGARVRGGISIDMQWRNGTFAGATINVDSKNTGRARRVRVVYRGTRLFEFTTVPGMSKVVGGVE